MKSERTYSLKEYYPWRNSIETHYPWQRQYLNREFLKYEQKRINESFEWLKKFTKTDNSGDLGDVSFYVVPLELSSTWRAAVADLGGYNYFGLSALFNSSQVLEIGLLSDKIKSPGEYRLINIVKSKRINLVNKRLNKVKPVVMIEQYVPLKSDYIYIDIPHEKKIVSKIINENLIDDDQISLSFQSPIISAPSEPELVGGISLSSISCKSTFANELVKTIQLMVPPEYRIITPPKGAHKGCKFQYDNGIKFHLAERPYFDRNVLSSLCAKKFNTLNRELFLRNNFPGEYSIFSTFIPDEGNETQLLNEWLKNFMATEIALPWELDELVYSDVDLMRLRKAINEDLWIQVVHFHQITPGFNIDINREFIRNVDFLNESIDVHLSEFNLEEESKKYLINTLLPHTKNNLRRISQSFARSEEKELVDIDHIKNAKNLLLRNLYGLLEHPRLSSIKFKMRRRKKRDPRYSIVQTEIINNPFSSTAQIFEAVKSTNQFKDIYDLQKFLDWLEDKNFIIKDINKRYLWVGRRET